MIWDDYFAENSTYDAVDFQRRFRMTSRLFDKIYKAIVARDKFFQ